MNIGILRPIAAIPRREVAEFVDARDQHRSGVHDCRRWGRFSLVGLEKGQP